MSLLIKHPGFATVVQDLGRFGCAHMGISPAGAADALSFRIANLLVGNPENAPALEMTLSGPTIEFQRPATLAITGASCELTVDGSAIPHSRAVSISAGSALMCGQMKTGVRAYLAVQGGILVPAVMGSASTHLAAAFGGFQGRSLRSEDVLAVGPASGLLTRPFRTDSARIPNPENPTPLRITRGAQHDWFSPEVFRRFLEQTFTVTPDAGRPGLRLAADPILARTTTQLLTEGVPLGAIQVPPGGQAIILFVDQQTTGGYPKIANVIAADLHRIGQLRPKDTVCFEEVSMERALQLLREQEDWLRTALVINES